MVGNEQGVIQRRDQESLHDYRVALRRTRSALSLFRGVLEPAMDRRGRKFFADLGRRTSKARDLDVLLVALPGYLDLTGDRSGLERLERRVAREKERQYAAIRRWLAGKTYERAMTLWQSDLDRLATTASESLIGQRAAKAIGEAASRAVRQVDRLGRKDPDATIHRLRIRFKKLRYALEFSRALAPGGEVEDFIGVLKLQQDELGIYQDLVVHGLRIEEFTRTGEGDSEIVLTGNRLVESLRRRRASLREAIRRDIGLFRAESGSKLRRVRAALGRSC